MTAVLILSVNTVRRNFITFFAYHHCHCTMLNSCINGMCKYGLYLFRSCGCGNIPIFRFTTKQTVPYAASYHIGFISRLR